ncbi:hypothetical protein KC851_01385 [Candidatus Kaiserbacteria bacterium]|nr:hypothetical protein [Candidatus Kaiserbacteria bacterium]
MSLNTIGNNRLEIHSADEERGDSVMVSGEGYEQLDLSDAKDITEFRNNIDNLYVAATELTATAEKDSYRLVAFEDVTGEQVFELLHKKYSLIQTEIDKLEDDILGNEDVREVQVLYNHINLLYNHIYNAYGSSVSQISRKNPEEIIGYFKSKGKQMVIEAANDEGEIAITVAKRTESTLAEETKKTTTPNLFTPQSVLDPNRAPIGQFGSRGIKSQLTPTNFSHLYPVDEVHEETSLTKKYLSDHKSVSYLAQFFSTPAAFEKILDSNISHLENRAYDRLEGWFNTQYASPFAYLQDFRLDEIYTLSKQDDRRDVLGKENIKYDAFLLWVDKIPEMLDLVEATDQTTLGELYAKWMVAEHQRRNSA